MPACMAATVLQSQAEEIGSCLNNFFGALIEIITRGVLSV